MQNAPFQATRPVMIYNDPRSPYSIAHGPSFFCDCSMLFAGWYDKSSVGFTTWLNLAEGNDFWWPDQKYFKFRKFAHCKKNNNWKFPVFTNLTQFTSGLRNCDMFAVTSWEVQVRKGKLTASRLDPFNFWLFWRGVFRLLTLGISNGGVLKMGDPQTNHMFQYENGQIWDVNSTAYHSPATLHPRNLRITSPQHLLPKDTPAPLQGSYCTVIMPHACDPVRCQYREWMLRKSVPSVSSNEFNQEESYVHDMHSWSADTQTQFIDVPSAILRSEIHLQVQFMVREAKKWPTLKTWTFPHMAVPEISTDKFWGCQSVILRGTPQYCWLYQVLIPFLTGGLVESTLIWFDHQLYG